MKTNTKFKIQNKLLLVAILAIFSFSATAGSIEYKNGYTVWNGSAEDYIPDVRQLKKRLGKWKRCDSTDSKTNIDYLGCTNRAQFILNNSMPGYFGKVSVPLLRNNNRSAFNSLSNIFVSRVKEAACGHALSGNRTTCSVELLDEAKSMAINYIMCDLLDTSSAMASAIRNIDKVQNTRGDMGNMKSELTGAAITGAAAALFGSDKCQ